MANAGDDNNNAQFFITDPFIVSNGSEVPAPLDRRSQFLNFNHTIVGILTSGFDSGAIFFGHNARCATGVARPQQ